MKRLSLLTPILFALACKGQELVVGAVDASTGSSAQSPSTDAGTTQTWTGYLQGFRFADGSDDVTLTLTFTNDVVTGTVVFGPGPIVAPPTDPSIGYPPSFEATAGPLTPSNWRNTWEDFAFTVLNGIFDGTRLTFDIQQREIWQQWCELQTAYTYPNIGCSTVDGGPCWDAGVSYGCVPTGGQGIGTLPDGGGSCVVGQSPFDCGRLSLCEGITGVCECTWASCDADLGAGDTHFDVRVDGQSISGTVVGVAQGGSSPTDTIPVILSQQF